MYWLSVVVIVALSGFSAAPAPALLATSCGPKFSWSGGNVDLAIGCNSGNAGGGGVHGVAGVPVYGYNRPVVDTGQMPPCVTTQRVVVPDQQTAAAQDAAQESRWQDLLSQYGPCPRTQVPVSPVGLAAQYWYQQTLDSPKPYIAPGRGVTGLDMFLELRVPLQRTLQVNTVLGDLALDVTGQATVDWADDVRSERFPPGEAGGPFPDGGIRHQWTIRGAYDVHVRVDWSATWHLAGQAGQLGGLFTDGDIPAFPVVEIQASGCQPGRCPTTAAP